MGVSFLAELLRELPGRRCLGWSDETNLPLGVRFLCFPKVLPGTQADETGHRVYQKPLRTTLPEGGQIFLQTFFLQIGFPEGQRACSLNSQEASAVHSSNSASTW